MTASNTRSAPVRAPVRVAAVARASRGDDDLHHQHRLGGGIRHLESPLHLVPFTASFHSGDDNPAGGVGCQELDAIGDINITFVAGGHEVREAEARRWAIAKK
jgi:hypothetical protein